MNIRAASRNLFLHTVRLGTQQSEKAARDRHNCDLVLEAVLSDRDSLKGIAYPVAYVEFLRSCWEYRAFSIREVRADGAPHDGHAKRFATLLEVLDDAPPIPFPLAVDIARIADRMAGLTEPIELPRWVGDAGLLFSIGSSSGRKGRLLFNLVRLIRPTRCLELGTAYGMSALFILGALEKIGGDSHLATIEGFEAAFSLSSAMLTARYGSRVSCEFGIVPDALTKRPRTLQSVDFLFHDAGHRGTDYVRDFEAFLPLLAPGAVVLFDDIRWEDPRFSEGPADAYEGWRTVASHARVKRAVEIGGTLGLMLLA